MKWATSISTAPTLEAAAQEATTRLVEGSAGSAPDLLLAFVSMHHAPDLDRLPELLRRELGPVALLGCSGGGVVGGDREVEREPALALTSAVLPGVEVSPFHLENSDVPAPQAGAAPLAETFGVDPATPANFILLPEPFSFDSEPLLASLDAHYPGGRTIGGLAGGGTEAESHALFLGDQTHRSGVVGVALSGDIEVDTVVAQGCRPVGNPMFVTSATGSIVHELDGAPALEALREVYGGLADRDKELFRHSLFFGIVMDGSRQVYSRGDFLIRNILGLDENTGALSVAALVDENAVVQLHLRDARTSSEDLDEMLGTYVSEHSSSAPVGALMFSCIGRGVGLYEQAGHDSGVLRRHLGAVPTGGFFCNGEIGEVGGRSFLHGYTSSFGLFRPKRAPQG